MSRLVVSPNARRDDVFVVDGEAYHHGATVLRLRSGMRCTIIDGTGHEYECLVGEMSAGFFTARIVRVRRPEETRVSVRLCCALLKGDKLDFALQKGTEVGVDTFVMFDCERATVRIAEGDVQTRRQRWIRITTSAVAQSRRPTIPDVRGPLSFDDMLACARLADLCLMPYEGRGLQRLSGALAQRTEARSVALLIGPEGGFTEGEVERARAAGIQPVTLGPRILRAETAAVIASALVLAAYGELG